MQGGWGIIGSATIHQSSDEHEAGLCHERSRQVTGVKCFSAESGQGITRNSNMQTHVLFLVSSFKKTRNRDVHQNLSLHVSWGWNTTRLTSRMIFKRWPSGSTRHYSTVNLWIRGRFRCHPGLTHEDETSCSQPSLQPVTTLKYSEKAHGCNSLENRNKLGGRNASQQYKAWHAFSKSVSFSASCRKSSWIKKSPKDLARPFTASVPQQAPNHWQ